MKYTGIPGMAVLCLAFISLNLLAGCGGTPQQQAKLTTIITTDLGKVNAVCVKAGTLAPVLVPIAAAGAGLVNPAGPAVVTGIDVLATAQCQAIGAQYQGLQAAAAAAPAAPPVAAAAPPTPAPTITLTP